MANALGVDADYGLDTSPEGQRLLSIQEREQIFGKNKVSAFKPRAAFAMTKELLKSQALRLIIIAAMVL